MSNTQDEDRALIVFRVATLFFEGMSTAKIAAQVNQEMRPEKPLTREGIYPLLREAYKLGLLTLTAPVEEGLATRVAEEFRVDRRHITVVRTPNQYLNEYVAERAARVTLDLMSKMAEDIGKEIGLGLGPGRATLDFSRYFSRLLEFNTGVRPIRLYAISAGCPAEYPEYSSISFFNLFPESRIAGRIGLFAESVVRCSEFEEIKKRPGVAEAFECKERGDVHVVVTSMGDFHDDHDLLSMFLERASGNRALPRDRGWIGNVQYRPYTQEGPAQEEDDDWRAVTLFEIPDFVAMAKSKEHHVVLIARQCARCGTTRAATLRPLLENPKLRVWSELVMDEATARDLLKEGAVGE